MKDQEKGEARVDTLNLTEADINEIITALEKQKSASKKPAEIIISLSNDPARPNRTLQFAEVK